MGCPCLILITQHYFEVSKISTLHKFTDPFPLGLQRIFPENIAKHIWIVMQEASDALSKTADSDTVSTYHVSSVQLVTDKKLEAFDKA